ncbi:YihY/virulence factor BrkB family protein [Sphingomonas montana]|uniref:YihY/virulence factor BrkB family protein n=1 Tax=Sphingomonas montana TaxID=1843236 RepID=UPI0009F91D81|nr:YihY/virulence factor BrkB family protein [Sphingomonas montana]
MTDTASAAHDPRGRDAISPWALPARGWKDVLVRTFKETGHDNIGLIAAGVAFYSFLSIVPLLGAMVLSYGLIAEPATVMGNIKALTEVMPADAARLIGEQLLNVVTTSGDKKGFGLLLALGLAFYGAMKAATAVITALDIAYEQEETRGFIKLNALALAITVGAVLSAIAAMIAIAALGHLEALLPGLPAPLLWLGKALSYLVMGAVGAAAAATLFRYGPDRDRAQWTWLTPGSLLSTLLWLLLTLGFGTYVANFGNYDATYGSLGAVVVLLTWIWLSAYVLLLGAELNSELEHQTAADTTRGPATVMGTRGATVADSVAGVPIIPDKPVAGVATAQPEESRAGRTLLAAGLGSRAGRVAGGGGAGMVPTLLVTAGLSCLRRDRRAGIGVLLLAAGGGLAWIGRRR